MWRLLLVVSMLEEFAEIPLLPHQMEFLESRAPYLAMVGGYGSGKTESCAWRGILQTRLDTGILHGIISPSFPTAKLTVIPALFEVLEDRIGMREGKKKDFIYNRVDHLFTIRPWDGKLVILSGENKNKGPNMGSWGIDEPGVQPYESFKQGVARVRHPKAKFPCLYMTGTPEDVDWFPDVVEGEKKPAGLIDIRARTRDNIFLTEQYFKNMEESYSAEELEAYMEGRFVNLNGAGAYHSFSGKNIIPQSEFEPDHGLPLIVGFDYNWYPNTAVIMQEVPDWIDKPGDEPARRLIAFDEVYIRGSTEDKCKVIREKYGDDFKYRIYQDATGDKNTSVGVSDLNLVQNAFKGTDYQVLYRPANPRRVDRLNAVNGRLCNAKGERFILITDNCKHLLADLKKSNRDEFMSGKYKDPERGHMGDAFGYPIEYRYPIIRQIKHSNRGVKV
jgi:hypothetical protein